MQTREKDATNAAWDSFTSLQSCWPSMHYAILYANGISDQNIDLLFRMKTLLWSCRSYVISLLSTEFGVFIRCKP